MVPYTKCYSRFLAPRESVRVPYWFEPEDMTFHFEWPAELLKLGMPKAFSIREITTNPDHVTRPEFGNGTHADVSRKVSHLLQSAGSRAATLLGRNIDLAAQTRAPVYAQVTQMDMW